MQRGTATSGTSALAELALWQLILAFLVVSLGLTSLTGCGVQEVVEEQPAARPAPVVGSVVLDGAVLREQAEAGDAGAVLDLAALAWGGRELLAREQGFHILGQTWLSVDWRQGLEIEMYRRYDPPAVWRRHVLRAGTEDRRVVFEDLVVAGDGKAWSRTSANPQPLENPLVLRELRESPSPRQLLLHRELGLQLAHHGTRKIPELQDLAAWAVTATYPDGRFVWAYVDQGKGLLRKLSYQKSSGMWVTSVFDRFRPLEEATASGLSLIEAVRLFQDGKLTQRFQWGRRESDPTFPEGIFGRPR